ncbi:MAG: methylated-DNA--[protein]-cysteine S-methyltransferase [Sphingomonadaceae bacterium]|nr:methylated-DNA--[protein]-cysteine S-methyltransferase [Sphingomonadales bacterium]MBP7134787.1 methylated-DNA--[protein]-cysteine S-methyltransferase [Sphingomonadaceae bacterium]
MCAVPATARIETPIGMIELVAVGDALTSVRIFPETGKEWVHRQNSALECAVDQMRAYFAGQRKFFDLPLESAASQEAHQMRCAIAAIPFGETATYGAVAQRVGTIPRAIGQACKINPFPIIIPCHRVISSSGREYYSAGAGPETKAWLIDFEAVHSHGIRTRLL